MTNQTGAPQHNPRLARTTTGPVQHSIWTVPTEVRKLPKLQKVVAEPVPVDPPVPGDPVPGDPGAGTSPAGLGASATGEEEGSAGADEPAGAGRRSNSVRISSMRETLSLIRSRTASRRGAASRALRVASSETAFSIIATASVTRAKGSERWSRGTAATETS